MNYSIFKNFIINRNDLPVETDFIKMLTGGFGVNKLDTKSGKVERKKAIFRFELCRLEWYKPMAGYEEFEDSFDLRSVKEIRVEVISQSFNKQINKAITFFFGKKFTLQKVTFIGDTTNNYEKFISLFRYFIEASHWVPFRAQIDIMLRREFEDMCSMPDNRKVVSLKDVKQILTKHHFKQTNEQLKKAFYEVDLQFTGQLDFDGFSKLYFKLIYTYNFVTDLIISQHFKDKKKLSIKELTKFFNDQQGMQMTENQTCDLVLRNSLDSMRHYELDLYFTDEEFISYLFSKENSIWNDSSYTPTQDMTKPLHYYWIASSHNTYLTGDQFKSESSVECYVRCLRMGCRCVELDCWDGTDGKPVIYHGRTLTTKISFVDVIKAIKENAFTTSPYPVILSLENHCSLKQQKFMAKTMIEIFGDNLLKEQIDENEWELPSPEKLKEKIIIKHKKIKIFQDNNSTSALSNGSSIVKRDSFKIKSQKDDNFDKDTDLCDLSDSIKAGDLHLYDDDDKVWKKYFVFLGKNRKINYVLNKSTTYIPSDDEEDEEYQSCNERYGKIFQTQHSYDLYREKHSMDDLHFGEDWFHGKLKDGRNEAESIINRQYHFGDGTFLVRESETHPGSYSLSYSYGNQIHHSIIKHKVNSTKQEYSLNGSVSFSSLYELIDFYRTHPLKSDKFDSLYLRYPAIQPHSHEEKEWFYSNLSRSDAEEMLSRFRHDGTFLVRKCQMEDNQYSLSFKVKGRIKHCRIKREGRLFVFGNREFPSLIEFVEFYQNHYIYQRIKLSFPATKENIRILGSDPQHLPASYLNPSLITSEVKAIACYDFQTTEPGEISLKIGNYITNIVKVDENWWKGDLSESISGLFPANFVQEIIDNPSTLTNGDDQEPFYGTIDLENVDASNVIVVNAKMNVFKVSNFTFMASSHPEMMEWIGKIRDTILLKNDKNSRESTKQMSVKIAQELNDLIIYCAATAYSGKSTNFREMCSIRESKITKCLNSALYRRIMDYSKHQIIRVYPEGTRINSSNYNPLCLWYCGVQMVALNYQTKDRPMQLNSAMFLQNGRCGYVLMPEYIRNDELYNPFGRSFTGKRLTLGVRILCARNLWKSLKDVLSPMIEIELIGPECDSKRYFTKTVFDNGLCPTWNDPEFQFHIKYSELCFLRFVVHHRDKFDEQSFVGQATFPISGLRKGFRSVRLCNEYSEKLELSTLLVRISFSQ